MSIDFDAVLTNEQKAEIIQQRITQFAAEAYQHELNKKTADELGSEEQIENINKNLEILETAINVHKEELDKLPLTPVE
jgi:hypothetical protein